jgi:hypothetical protein
MRLARFLLVERNTTGYDEPRSKTVGWKWAVNYVLKNCHHSLKGTTLKRDIDVGWRDETRFTDPKKGKPRISRNTSNHYTLIVDNSPKWKRYPPRSQSIICSTRSGMFYVFPENKSRIGVCPSYDFWPSFTGSGIWDMDGFNISLSELAYHSIGKEGPWDRSYDEVIGVFADIDAEKMRDPDAFVEKMKKQSSRHGSFMSDSSNEFLFQYIRDSSARLYPYIENLLDPNKNGFKIKFPGSNIPGEKEVWTDGKAILVNHRFMETFMNEISRLRQK